MKTKHFSGGIKVEHFKGYAKAQLYKTYIIFNLIVIIKTCIIIDTT